MTIKVKKTWKLVEVELHLEGSDSETWLPYKASNVNYKRQKLSLLTSTSTIKIKSQQTEHTSNLEDLSSNIDKYYLLPALPLNIGKPWLFPQQFRDREGPLVRAEMMWESKGKTQSYIYPYFQAL